MLVALLAPTENEPCHVRALRKCLDDDKTTPFHRGYSFDRIYFVAGARLACTHSSVGTHPTLFCPPPHSLQNKHPQKTSSYHTILAERKCFQNFFSPWPWLALPTPRPVAMPMGQGAVPSRASPTVRPTLVRLGPLAREPAPQLRTTTNAALPTLGTSVTPRRTPTP